MKHIYISLMSLIIIALGAEMQGAQQVQFELPVITLGAEMQSAQQELQIELPVIANYDNSDFQLIDSEQKLSADQSPLLVQSRKNLVYASAAALASLPGYTISLAHQLPEVPNEEGKELSATPNGVKKLTPENIRRVEQTLAEEVNIRRAESLNKCKETCGNASECACCTCLWGGAIGMVGFLIYVGVTFS